MDNKNVNALLCTVFGFLLAFALGFKVAGDEYSKACEIQTSRETNESTVLPIKGENYHD